MLPVHRQRPNQSAYGGDITSVDPESTRQLKHLKDLCETGARHSGVFDMLTYPRLKEVR